MGPSGARFQYRWTVDRPSRSAAAASSCVIPDCRAARTRSAVRSRFRSRRDGIPKNSRASAIAAELAVVGELGVAGTLEKSQFRAAACRA